MKNKMTRGICFTLSLLLAIALASTNALAVNEDSVGVSCQFLDSSGDPITGANVVVSIYNSSTGGSQLYSETFNSATDSNGVCTFNTLASSSTLPLTEGQEYFLDLTVNGNDYDFNGIERQAFIAWFGQNKQVSGDVAAAGNLSGANFQADSSNTRAGVGSSTTANSGTAYGENTVSGDNAVSVGTNAEATNAWAIAVGSGSNAQSNGAISIGYNNFATNGAGAVSIGQNAAAQDNGDGQIAIGREASARDNKAIAIGDDVDINAGGSNSVVLGHTYSGAEANQFIYFPGSEVFRANATGAYAAGNQLATQSYVQANSASAAGTSTELQYRNATDGSFAPMQFTYNDSWDGYLPAIELSADHRIGLDEFGNALGILSGYYATSIWQSPEYLTLGRASTDNWIRMSNQSGTEVMEFIKADGIYRFSDFQTGSGSPTFDSTLDFSSSNGKYTIPATNGTLATEAYVQANAGVDESANYTWTGTHNYTGATLQGVVSGTGDTEYFDNSVLLGSGATATALSASWGVSIGHDASGTYDGVVIGGGASGGANGVVAIGRSATGTGNAAVVIGKNTGSAGGVAIGDAASSQGWPGVAIGANAVADDRSVAIGTGADATDATSNDGRSIAIGENAQTGGYQAVSVGYGATASGANAVALGPSVTNTQDNSFVSGDNANEWIRANTTGVYDISGKLATEAYVLANGVDESADYNWTGTNRFTNTANEFTGTSFTLDDGSVITDNGSCTTISSPYGTNQISLCANKEGLEVIPFTFWSTNPPDKAVQFTGCGVEWDLETYMNGNWEHAVDELNITINEVGGPGSDTLTCTLSGSVGGRSCSDSGSGLASDVSMTYNENAGTWLLDFNFVDDIPITMEAFADGESSGTFQVTDGSGSGVCI